MPSFCLSFLRVCFLPGVKDHPFKKQAGKAFLRSPAGAQGLLSLQGKHPTLALELLVDSFMEQVFRGHLLHARLDQSPGDRHMSQICSHRACAVLCLVTQSCPTLCDPMGCSTPGSSVLGDSPDKSTGVGCHSLLQGDSRPKNRTGVSCMADSLPSEPPGKPSYSYMSYKMPSRL